MMLVKSYSSPLLVPIVYTVPVMQRKGAGFLGANAPLGPASSEGLSVCLYVCMSVTL